MTIFKNIANVVLGICYEIFFALVLIAGAALISFLLPYFYLKP